MVELTIFIVCVLSVQLQRQILDQEPGIFAARGWSGAMVAMVTACLLCFPSPLHGMQREDRPSRWAERGREEKGVSEREKERAGAAGRWGTSRIQRNHSNRRGKRN